MCGPFVTMYAACRRRDWEPPPQIDAAGLRRWMAEVLRDDAIPLHRGVCKHCGASLLRPGPDLLDNMGKCEPGCPPAADPDELLIIEPPTSAGHKRPAPGPDLTAPDSPKKVQCTAASSPGSSNPLAAASRPRPGSARRRLELTPTHFATSPSPGPVAGVPPGVERSQLVVDGQRGSSSAVTNVDMMEVDGDSAMQEAPASAGVAVDFGHDNGARAAAHLGADAAATAGGAPAPTRGPRLINHPAGGPATTDSHGGAAGANQCGRSPLSGAGAGVHVAPAVAPTRKDSASRGQTPLGDGQAADSSSSGPGDRHFVFPSDCPATRAVTGAPPALPQQRMDPGGRSGRPDAGTVRQPGPGDPLPAYTSWKARKNAILKQRRARQGAEDSGASVPPG